MQDDKTLKWFERNGLTPPSSVPHGVKLEDMSERLQPLKIRSWKLQGNKLIAFTDVGEVVNYIDPGLIMTGTKDNLPVFKRI